MALFKSKQVERALPASTSEARQLHFVQNASAQRVLALGMTWRTVMVAGGATTAMRMARTAKATHYCQIDGQVVGFGKIPQKKSKAEIPDQVYPAGTLAGRRCGGNGVFALTISESEVWMLVVQNGRPSGAEEIFADGNESAQHQAVARCLALIDSEQGISVYTDIDTPEFDVMPFSMNELLEIAPSSDDRLVALVTKSGLEGLSVPKPLIAAALFGVVCYGAWTAYGMHVAQKLAEEKALEAARIAREEVPEVVWKKAFDTMRETHAQPSSTSFGAVRKSFDELPAQWLGWTLKTAACKADLPVLKKQLWSCIANYDVTAKLGSATNAQLKPTVPKGYTVNFSPTRAMTLLWSVQIAIDPMVQEGLPTRAEHLVTTASRLQELIPVLSEAPTMAFTPMKIDPPLGEKSHALIPMPKSVVIPSEAKLMLRGPLRSIDAALGRGVAADWNSFLFTYDPTAKNTGSSSFTELRHSTLQVEINGMIYAKD